MREVKRHSVTGYGRQDINYNDPEGEFVYYEDYAALQQKLDALAAENAHLRDFMLEYCVVECDDGYGVIELPAEGFFPKTPATDAYLNLVRAEGAQMCIDALVKSDDEDFIDAPNICSAVMHALRSGTHDAARGGE